MSPHNAATPQAPNDPLMLALEVLDSDPEEFPDLPDLQETLFARHQSNGLPMWWPTFHPDEHRPWKDLSERRAVLRERLERTLPVGSLTRPLTPTMRRNAVKSFRLIASELRAMGFDTPV